ncbi:Hypothetical protein POVN_LOCUS506 [uncultured virus]|nr:Hypothetical protein POVN_LOCUS506 [uncultured virus]
MARLYDFVQVIHLLSDELKKYEQDPTPEKATQLNEWLADYMKGGDDFYEALVHSINTKMSAPGVVYPYQTSAFPPSTTRDQRKSLEFDEEVLAEVEETARVAALKGYDYWEANTMQESGIVSRGLQAAYPGTPEGLAKLQALVVEPEFQELALPLPGEGKYVSLSEADIAKMKSSNYFVYPSGKIVKGQFAETFLPYAAYAVGLQVDPNHEETQIRDATLFGEAAGTPAYQKLIGRMIKSSAIFTPKLSQALRTTIASYMAEHTDLLESILPVYTSWMAVLKE